MPKSFKINRAKEVGIIKPNIANYETELKAQQQNYTETQEQTEKVKETQIKTSKPQNHVKPHKNH